MSLWERFSINRSASVGSESGISIIMVVIFVAIMAALIVVVVPNMTGTLSRSKDSARAAERINVERATEIWKLQATNPRIVGSAPNSRPASSLTNIVALGGASLYPTYFKNPTAMEDVGYCWDTQGKLTQKLLTQAC